MVQLLPLITCSRYKTVQVLHQAFENECALMVSPWQQPIGSPCHDFVSMEPLENGVFAS